jgi:hypothetical protein
MWNCDMSNSAINGSVLQTGKCNEARYKATSAVVAAALVMQHV